MKNAINFLILFFTIGSFCYSKDFESYVPSPSDKEQIKGMVWNKWETENFIVLSIDFSFGNKLKSSIENDRKKLLELLQVKDAKLPVKCKIVCVPDPAILNKFFSLKDPRFEIRPDNSGGVGELAIWIDQERSNLLMAMVAGVSFYNKPIFLREGVSALLCGPNVVYNSIVSSDSSPSCDIFSLDDKEKVKKSDSVIVCLFLRKEFGINLFSTIISESKDPISVCGFENKETMENTIKRYWTNLKSDADSGIIPYSYLNFMEGIQ